MLLIVTSQINSSQRSYLWPSSLCVDSASSKERGPALRSGSSFWEETGRGRVDGTEPQEQGDVTGAPPRTEAKLCTGTEDCEKEDDPQDYVKTCYSSESGTLAKRKA